jgi:hypothetical protein
MKGRFSVIVFAIAMIGSQGAHADHYKAIGPFKGSFCTGFVVESCEFKTIDRLKQNGQMFWIKKVYEDVDEVHDGKCWTTVKSRSGGVTGWLKDSTLPEFYFQNENLGVPDYIVFPCVTLPE